MATIINLLASVPSGTFVSNYTQPSSNIGTVSVKKGVATYISNSFIGTDHFSYTLMDLSGNSSTATVSIQVESDCQGCDPIAVSVPNVVNGPQYLSVGTPSEGTAMVDPDHPCTILYYPPCTGLKDAVTIPYTVTDTQGNSSSATITVDGCDFNPSLDKSISYSGNIVAIDLLEGAGVGSTVSNTTVPLHGMLTVCNGTAFYESSAPLEDSFQYTVINKCCNTATGTVSLHPIPVQSVNCPINTITTTFIQSLTVTQLTQLDSSFLSSLTTTQISSLTTTQIDGLTPTQISSLTTTQIDGLTPTQISSLTTTQIDGLTPTQIRSMDPSQLSSIKMSVYSIAAKDADKSEGDSGTTQFTFDITRTGDISSAVTVNWLVGSANDPSANAVDFGGTYPSGSVSFAANETTKTISVPVSGDTDVEPDENFTVCITAPAGSLYNNQCTNGIIRNDDVASVIINDPSSGQPITCSDTAWTLNGSTSTGYICFGTIPANTYLGFSAQSTGPYISGTGIQMFTKDGHHIVGCPQQEWNNIDIVDDVSKIVSTTNGFNPGAVYSQQIAYYKPFAANNTAQTVSIDYLQDLILIVIGIPFKYRLLCTQQSLTPTTPPPGGNPRTMSQGDVGIFAGGANRSSSSMEFISISNSSAGAASFGTLSLERYCSSSCSNGSHEKGLIGGNYSPCISNIEYVTINTPSAASYFGDLVAPNYYMSSTSNSSNDTGLFIGGYWDNNNYYIQKTNITSGGTANCLTAPFLSGSGATSNGTNSIAVFGVGGGSATSSMYYLNILTTVGVSSFGQLLSATSRGVTACSNGTGDRGLFAGITQTITVDPIEYITISTPSNATNFGDFANADSPCACSNGTGNVAVFGGSATTFLSAVNIMTLASFSSFGNLSVPRSNATAFSNA